MGHQSGKAETPRRGSLQFYPRVRAKRHYPRIRKWPQIDEVKPLGFAGYKAGMAHVLMVDNRKDSPTKGQTISVPVTIIDVPKIKVAAIRFYKIDKFRTKKVAGEIWANNLDKDLGRKIKLPKKSNGKEIDNPYDVTLLVYTLPKGRTGKKKPEIFEIAIGGNDVQKKLEYAKGVLGKELSVKDIFSEGDVVDVVAVTKGYGFTGVIKRFGAKLHPHKTDKGRRMISPIGEDVPRKSNWRVPMMGQYGFFTRTEKNKQILKIGDSGIEQGLHRYGLVKGDYIILAGSVPGPKKRLIRLKFAMHPPKSGVFEQPKVERLVL